ncbi:MAG: NAD(P)-binding domain-containing protein [Sideroxyarcus sp.]|nr:NAD(P)-binding domain-containing protein [Sideroxyarcus sp.]
MDILDLAVYLVPLVVIMLFYLGRMKKTEKTSVAQMKEAISQGLTEPASLHPVVDPVRCLGSGSCIKACPELALGMIKGKAVLINPTLCIGHGACAAACPQDAITLVFGTEKRGMDIPRVDPTFETNIKGIFIAGELGGMGLIRKAASQGSQAMDAIAKLKGSANDYDVVIVGAGPAGLGASLGALHHKLRYVALEQETSLGGAVFQYPRNKIAMTAPVKLPVIGEMHFKEVSKEKLLEFWLDIIEKTGIRINYNERMENVTPTEGGFIVKTSKGEYKTRTVLLAIGRRGTPRKLGVAGEELPKVVYRLIDPEQYRNMHVIVVGGGDSAVEAAMAVAGEPGTTVSLLARGEDFGKAFGGAKPKNRDKLKAMSDAGKLKIYLKSGVKQVNKDTAIIKFGDEEVEIPNDGIIVCAGGTLPTPFLKQIGVMVETKFGTV